MGERGSVKRREGRGGVCTMQRVDREFHHHKVTEGSDNDENGYDWY
jgi:hypothetical protein